MPFSPPLLCTLYLIEAVNFKMSSSFASLSSPYQKMSSKFESLLKGQMVVTTSVLSFVLSSAIEEIILLSSAGV